MYIYIYRFGRKAGNSKWAFSKNSKRRERERGIYVIFPLLIVQDLWLNTRVILNANVPAGNINRVRAITRNVSARTVSLHFRSGNER